MFNVERMLNVMFMRFVRVDLRVCAPATHSTRFSMLCKAEVTYNNVFVGVCVPFMFMWAVR